MIDLFFNFNVLATTPNIVSNNYPYVSCNSITTVPMVCNKRMIVVTGKPTKYYLTLSNGQGEFQVNKCTYNASALYGYYVIDTTEGKWCPIEP